MTDTIQEDAHQFYVPKKIGCVQHDCDHCKAREVAESSFQPFMLHIDGVALTADQAASICQQATDYAEAMVSAYADHQKLQDWFVWDGSYEKQSYDVWVKGCDVVLGCWPNAGKMSSTDGSGRQWNVNEVLAVRVSNFQGRFPNPPKRIRQENSN